MLLCTVIKFHFLESVVQTQNLLTESPHASKVHNVDDTKVASIGPMEQEDEVLDGTLASNFSDATRAFFNVCEYLYFNISRFTKMEVLKNKVLLFNSGNNIIERFYGFKTKYPYTRMEEVY